MVKGGSNQIVESRGPKSSLVLYSILSFISMTFPIQKEKRIRTTHSKNCMTQFPNCPKKIYVPCTTLAIYRIKANIEIYHFKQITVCLYCHFPKIRRALFCLNGRYQPSQLSLLSSCLKVAFQNNGGKMDYLIHNIEVTI